MITANGSYRYEKENVFGTKYKLEEFAVRVHEEYSKMMGWEHNSLKRGSYGFEGIVMCIGHLEKESKDLNIEDVKLYNIIHDAWSMNYNYWKTNKPWETRSVYKKPYSELADERRDKCAVLTFEELDEDEQGKDMYLLSAIKKVIRSANCVG